MKSTTCAACDCELDGGAVQVALGGQTVEACCEACAQKLNEPQASAREEQRRATGSSNRLPEAA
ncbi:MAG TPA: hypothetical protein VFT22_16540 [Kofleriaceae bacterium]|nr:hypothetical protein [Kofleriaceae bacterium]